MLELKVNINATHCRGRKHLMMCVYVILLCSTFVDTIRALESEEYVEDRDALSDLENATQQQDHNWDVLIFTQQWPVTTCLQWKEKNKEHQCNLPTKKEIWTIHGIWPTKLDTVGPNFCNHSIPFDIDKLAPIEEQLFLFWPDIETESDPDFLWKHEWLKHGTCAAQLEQLDNELKYFQQGLNWHSGFFMSEVLEKAGIYPDSNNTVIGLHTALVKVLGKNPSIHCDYDNKNNISYLAEIRICFDKSLQLIDCDGVRFDQVSINYPGGTVNTNCHASKPIHYPSNVPPVERQNRRKDSWKFPFVNMYKLVQFLIWCTL